MAKNVKAHLSFAWTGDFESLKQLVGENLKLVGSWSQPEGDKKVFSSSTNMSITWRKNKNSLTEKGEGATNILKEFLDIYATMTMNNICIILIGRQAMFLMLKKRSSWSTG